MNETESAPTGEFQQKSHELRARIERVAFRDRDEELERNLKTVQDKLRKHIQAAVSLMQALRVMRAANLVGAQDLVPVTGKVESLVKKIGTLQTRLKNERSKLRTDNTWGLCDTEAGALAKSLDEKLRDLWRQFVAREIRNTDTFQPFRSLQGCAPILTELDKLTRTLREHQTQLPDSAAAVAAVTEKGAQMDVEIAKLKVDGIPASVLAFLKQAATGGIVATELTDEILACLRERQFVGSLRIVAGATAGLRSF